METFAADLRNRQKDRTVLDEIENRLRWLMATRTAELDGYLLSPVSQLPSKVGELLHLGVYRTVELAESSIREMNNRRVVSSALLVRGAFETSCLLYELIRRIETVTSSHNAIGIADLSTFVTNTLLGHGPKAKQFFLFEEFVTTNVLTHIQKLSRELKAPFEGFYEGLSEYCHPNSHGMIQLFTTKHQGGVSYFTERNEVVERGAMALIASALAIALGLVEDALKRWGLVADILAALAEEYVFNSGTWPRDMPYPIDRAWLERSRTFESNGEEG